MILLITIINEFGCYEAKIDKSEKGGSRRESNPGHLWLELPAGRPPTPTILYVWYWMPQSHTWQPLSMFLFLCFCLITSKFEFQREARCSQHWLQLLEPELSMNTITKITYNPRLVSIIEKWLGWAPLPYSWLFWQALKLANWSLIWRIRVRRMRPRCALSCARLRASHSRARELMCLAELILAIW